MLAAAEDMAERFRAGEPLRGTLRIRLSETIALVCLGELLQQLEHKYPAIKASMFIGDSGKASRKLQDGEFDIALVAEPELPAHMKPEFVGYSRLGWFAAPALRVGRHALVPAGIASHHLLIGPPPLACIALLADGSPVPT